MLARNEPASAPSVEVCAERQRLLDLLRGAIEDLSAAVRDLREPDDGGNVFAAKEERTAAPLSACERIWADLRRHQAVHRCWR